MFGHSDYSDWSKVSDLKTCVTEISTSAIKIYIKVD